MSAVAPIDFDEVIDWDLVGEPLAVKLAREGRYVVNERVDCAPPRWAPLPCGGCGTWMLHPVACRKRTCPACHAYEGDLAYEAFGHEIHARMRAGQRAVLVIGDLRDDYGTVLDARSEFAASMRRRGCIGVTGLSFEGDRAAFASVIVLPEGRDEDSVRDVLGRFGFGARRFVPLDDTDIRSALARLEPLLDGRQATRTKRRGLRIGAAAFGAALRGTKEEPGGKQAVLDRWAEERRSRRPLHWCGRCDGSC